MFECIYLQKQTNNLALFKNKMDYFYINNLIQSINTKINNNPDEDI